MSLEFAVSYVDKIRQHLGDDFEGIMWDKVEVANRYTYNFKLVLAMKETADCEHDRREAYRAKDLISKFLGEEEYYINGKRCFIAVQASPARRELFAKAGQCTPAVVELCGDAGMAAKREYSSQGVTVLAWKLPLAKKNSSDKSRHLDEGRWIRVAEWGKNSGWKVYPAEYTIFGVDADSLRDRLTSDS